MCVYGIYVDEDLVYIGKTKRNVEERFKEHKRIIEHLDKYKGSQKDLYYGLRAAKDAGKNVYMNVLIDADKVKTNIKLGNWEICTMELALITLWQPMYNIEGVTKDYRFEY